MGVCNIILGLSTRTCNQPTRCNCLIRTRKPADPTPVTVNGRSQPPATKTDGSVDGSTLQNPIPTNPTSLYIGNKPIFAGMRNFRSFVARYVKIWQDLDRSFEIWLDLVKILRVLLEISLDQAMCRPDLPDFDHF